MPPTSYPVRLTAELDPRLSRGLWIVKPLLALPHIVVLVLLWIAFAVTTVIAFFAILLSARYPRGIFDFNVGVLRWSWRVTYYTVGAFATDRYPPFALADVPDYPAHLEVAYPQRLSRGLVLVKWWLLAIPHYLIVGAITGPYADLSGVTAWLFGSGLLGILVVVAAFTLLITGSYPRSLFDLIIGLQRWLYRVTAYVSLMTDAYPPFRLDQGGEEPAPPATVLATDPA